MRKQKKISLWLAVPVLLAILIVRPATGFSGQIKDAATLSLETILQRLSTYEFGQDENILWQLRDFVRGHKDAADARAAAEDMLDGFLATKATLAGKMTVCRELRLIGSEKSVPVLEKMLLDKDLTDLARYALENIQGDAPDKALLRALTVTKGETRIGVIAAIGRRKARAAVPALAQILSGADAELSKSVATALGEIGGREAADTLLKALPAARPDIKDSIAAGLMKTAAEMSAAGDAAASARIYETLLAEKISPPLRLAAWRGRFASAGDKTAALVLETLAGPDPLAREAAIGAIPSAFNAASIGDVAVLFSRLPAESQVQLLSVLSDYPKGRILPTILQATGSDLKDVRIAALNALQKAGDATSVMKLAETAAGTTAAEQTAARNALWGLKGKVVDDAVLSGLASAKDDGVQTELVRAVGERRIYAGKSLVFQFTNSPSSRLQTQAIRAIRAIGTPSDVSGMLDLLLAPENEAARRDIENTIVSLAQKISNPVGRAATVNSRLTAGKDPKDKSALLRVLGRVGDDSTLSSLRHALKDKNPDVADTAARALFGWPSATAKDDVFAIAKSSANPTHKILALQSYIRMTGLEKYRSPSAAVKDFKKALKLAARPEEKKLILGVLPDFYCPDALKLAATLLPDKDVAAEAQVALDKVKTRLEQDAKIEAI
jgi:HEAT repeat protein